jgi:hypothetical protein
VDAKSSDFTQKSQAIAPELAAVADDERKQIHELELDCERKRRKTQKDCETDIEKIKQEIDAAA